VEPTLTEHSAYEAGREPAVGRARAGPPIA